MAHPISPTACLCFGTHYTKGRASFEVHGTLQQTHGSESRVLLTSNSANPAPGDWRGVVLQSLYSYDLSNLEIRYADIGVDGGHHAHPDREPRWGRRP